MNLPVLIIFVVTVLTGVGTTYYSGVQIELEARLVSARSVAQCR
jgi:hypothetical protein